MGGAARAASPASFVHAALAAAASGGIARQCLLGGVQDVRCRVVGFRLGNGSRRCSLAVRKRLVHVLQFCGRGGGPVLEDVADLDFLRILDQFRFAGSDLFQDFAVHRLRNRHAGDLHRQPDHGDHVGDNQDDVLRDLRPRDRAHAPQERAHQDAAQPQEDPDFERHAGQPRRDQPYAIDLRHDVSEGAQDRGTHADEARNVSAIPRAEKVRNRELAELAQIGRQEQGHQAITAGPAEDECQAVEAQQVERSRHPDERRGGHPVRPGCHAVEQRGHTTARHVVLRRIGSPAHHADAGIKAHRCEQENVADPGARQPHLLRDCQDNHERDEPARVPCVDLLELGLERAVGRAAEHSPSAGRWRCHQSSSPSCTS